VACEKCWGDAYTLHFFDPSKTQAEYYHILLAKRVLKPCSQEEQAGELGEKE
jgi:hypothetical protein